jgi:hypothetical protein
MKAIIEMFDFATRCLFILVESRIFNICTLWFDMIKTTKMLQKK